MNRILAFLFGLLACGVAYAAPSPITVPNIATLIAGNFSSYPTVQVLGYYTAGDGGGGMFNWSSASTATTDVCMTFQTGGLTTGRFVRQLQGNVLSLLQCGVKADNSTDNTTAMQAAFNAMSTYSLGEIYCPAAAQNYRFAGPVTPIGGGTFRGQANSQAVYLASSTTPPGACHLYHTGTGLGFDFQTPFQSIAACPSVPGPKFYNFTMQEATTGNSIRVNNSSTAGFTDDCVGAGGGQSQVFGTVIDGVTFASSERGTTAVELNKAFDSTITNSTFSFYDTQLQVKGSDNVEIFHNFFSFATLRELDLISSGTFGNFNNVRDNTFFTPYINATDFIRSSARSGVIDGNYFEADYSGITNVLNLTCALSHTVTNNTMALLPVNVAYWLSVTGDCTQITLTNNYPLGGGFVPSIWNANAGSHWFSNSTKQKIFAWGNPDDNEKTPFVTREPVPLSGNGPNTYSGSVVGVFDASSSASIAGNYASTITIGPNGYPGAFAFAAVAAAGGHVTFKMNPAVRGTVDEYIYAATAGSINQQITCSDGISTTTMTMTTGAIPAWYKFSAAGGDAVTDPTIDCYNNDTGHGQTVYVYKWVAVIH